jgi:hypothetical protein
VLAARERHDKIDAEDFGGKEEEDSNYKEQSFHRDECTKRLLDNPSVRYGIMLLST